VDVAELQSPDTANVCLHITGTFSESLYTVTVSTAVRDSNGQQLSGYPDNTASFSGTGTTPESFIDGPVIEDPMNETSTNFSMLIKYRGRVYIGPADTNNAVYRLKPDGSDPEMISFRFHVNSTYTDSLDPGPNSEDGIDYITGGFINSEEYLFIGPSKSGGGLNYIYHTSESRSTLNFRPIDLSAELGIYSVGVSSMTVFNNNLYGAFVDTILTKPMFLKISNVVENPILNTDYFNPDADDMPRIGAHGSPSNEGGIVGIDSFGIFQNRLFLANGGNNKVNEDGGIIRSTVDDPIPFSVNPADWEDLTPIGIPEWYDGGNRFSTELEKKNKLIPSDKAFPAMIVFNNKLFVIRNTDNYSNRPQLWKYDGTSWSLVADNRTVVCDMGYGDNYAASLLVVNGDRLYIGYNNSSSGLQVWRTLAGVTDPQFESDFEPVTTDGLGDPVQNQRIYHAISIVDKDTHYLWLLCGKSGDSLRVYRTKNDN
jgi:hypothetical protein